jgi:N-acyl amino acid synthase of PEP-CTERM/exosortase system
MSETAEKPNPKRATLGDGYRQYFEVMPALETERINDVHFIRHDVYARDLGFEAVRPDQRESDKYDRHAVHCLVRTAAEPVRLAGCARVVLTDPLNRNAPLPMEVYCKDAIDRSIIDPAKLPREKIAEISRVAVMGEFRRRKGEQGHEAPVEDQDFGDDKQPRFPYIPISLYFAAAQMALRHHVEYLFTLTEPRLASHFVKMGIKVIPIGSAVEHRGLRVPSMIMAREVYGGLRSLVRPVWDAVEDQMKPVYARQAANS